MRDSACEDELDGVPAIALADNLLNTPGCETRFGH